MKQQSAFGLAIGSKQLADIQEMNGKYFPGASGADMATHAAILLLRQSPPERWQFLPADEQYPVFGLGDPCLPGMVSRWRRIQFHCRRQTRGQAPAIGIAAENFP